MLNMSFDCLLVDVSSDLICFIFYFLLGEIGSHRAMRPNELPENTIFGVNQAKFIHYQNMHLPSNKKNKTCGAFLLELTVVGQIQPGNEKVSKDVITESTEHEAVEKVSNPGYELDGVKRKFRPNFQSDVALFSTIADKQVRYFLDFGAEKVQSKAQRQNYGRRECVTFFN